MELGHKGCNDLAQQNEQENIFTNFIELCE